MVAGVHLVVFAAVYWMAFLLRFDFVVPADYAPALRATLPWVLVAKFVIFLALGHFDGWWAYVTFADLIALIRSSILAMLCFITINYFSGVYAVPRSIPILDCVGTIVLLGALRGSWRVYHEQFWPMFNQGNARWALLVGTDHSHGVLAHQIQSHGELPYRIRGFLCTDESPETLAAGPVPRAGQAGGRAGNRRRLQGDRRAGDRRRPGRPAAAEPDERLREGGAEPEDHPPAGRPSSAATIASPSATSKSATCCGAPRSSWTPRGSARCLEGRTVMVTGAGGSIGSEICRQACGSIRAILVLVGRGENRIFKIERKLQTLRLHGAARLHRQRHRPARIGSSSKNTSRRSFSTRPPTSTCR